MMKPFLHLLFALFSLATLHVHADDFLDPDEAFKFSAKALDATTLEARWTIADGYYMYHKKLKFELQGAKLGQPVIPAGKIHKDESFGDVEIHRNVLVVKLPVARNPGGELPVTLKTTYQGCADAGLCYTPMTQTNSFKLAAYDAAKPVASAPASALAAKPAVAIAPLASPVAQTKSALAGLQSLTEDAAGPMEIVPPEKAFKADVMFSDPQTLIARYTVNPCCYLYRDKLKFDVKIPAGITVDRIDSPAGDIKEDPAFGKIGRAHV
jgi:thiol:disulfide interchange protein DsbD